MLDDSGIKLELSVNVEKDKLLNILKENLEKHKTEYSEAREGWHKKLIEQLKASKANAQSMLDSALSGRDGDEDPKDDDWTKQFDNVRSLVPEDWYDEPTSYANHYEDAIEMLDMAKDETVTLSRTLYKQLVQDSWGWKDRHTVSMQKYIGIGRV